MKCQIANAQNFILLENYTGYNYNTAELTEFVAVADSLVAALPNASSYLSYPLIDKYFKCPYLWCRRPII